MKRGGASPIAFNMKTQSTTKGDLFEYEKAITFQIFYYANSYD